MSLTRGYYHKKKNVEEYIKIAQGYDGKQLIDVLKNHLAEGSTLLELGMGPGKDLEMLAKSYKVTGSDHSQVFLDLYKESRPDADLELLDAITLETGKRFDGIYSNKVLHHLTTPELEASLARQSEILNISGYVMHSFWRGAGQETYEGFIATYYMETDLAKLFQKNYKVIEICSYKEIDPDDSIYVLAQKK